MEDDGIAFGNTVGHVIHSCGGMEMNSAATQRSGFTLVELLVVIAIIAMLATISLPVISRAMESVRRAQAQTEVRSIESAVLAYLNEYGRFPHGSGGPDVSYGESGERENSDLINVLRADRDHIARSENPRYIMFLEVPEQRLVDEDGNIDGNYRDPWGRPYEIIVDTNFDNVIDVSSVDPDAGDQGEIRRRVAVWSYGPGEGEDPEKYVKSWD